MAYTGTGKKDDPYIVDSWDSYYNLLQGSNRYVAYYFKFADVDNKTVDFNDIKPEGYTVPIQCNGFTDFNGWTFRNLRMINVISVFDTASRAETDKWNNAELKNGKFENMYIESTNNHFGFVSYDAFPWYWLHTSFKNMSFSGTFVFKGTNSTNLIGYVNGYSGSGYTLYRYIGCSFNLDIVLPNDTTTINISDGCDVENCSFKLKTQSNAEIKIAYNTYKKIIYSKILNSLIQLDAPNATINVNNQTDNNGNLDDRFSTCVIVPTCKELKSTAKCVTTVYNSDNIETDSTTGSELITCTTEQLGSVDYLQSVGFPIGAG
nr:MAG TPA: hypothetical protein [Caudoviricetes sp.]